MRSSELAGFSASFRTHLIRFGASNQNLVAVSGGFLRSRFLSFAMVGGICFLLLVPLTLESVLKAFSHYVQSVLPGGIVLAVTVYLIFDLAVIILLFATMFKYLPNAKIHGAMSGLARS